MHIRKLTRRLTPWLTFYLLVVSVGLPLQRVYCACVGQAALTLPGSEHECDAHAPRLSEHDHHRMACCLATEDCQQPEAADHDCGSSEVIVAALDADFPLETVGDYTAVPSAGMLPARPVYPPPAARAIGQSRPVRGPDPPARPAGRDLLVAHQTFLI